MSIITKFLDIVPPYSCAGVTDAGIRALGEGCPLNFALQALQDLENICTCVSYVYVTLVSYV